jgi:lipocalin
VVEMMMRLSLGVVLMALVASAGVATAKEPELTTVDSVELDRYLGEWYEIASYPAWFQRDCTAVSAHYSLRDDGLIKVVNSCRKGSLDGKPTPNSRFLSSARSGENIGSSISIRTTSGRSWGNRNGSTSGS